MSKIVVIEYVSLDGVIQAPGYAAEDTDGGFEHGGWTKPFIAEHAVHMSELFRTVGGFMLGRRTYEIWAAYWPTVTDPADEIAQALNTLPKYVASTTLDNPTWESTTVLRHAPTEVAELRRQPGKPILVQGSSRLAHTLTEHALVDEYRLWIHPVILGSGKKLFRDGGAKVDLTLIETRTSPTGLVMLTYAPD
jgi:dihydrofolate reductase